MQGPNRSTIELERTPRRGGWRTREGRRSPVTPRPSGAVAAPPLAPTIVEVAEPREPSVFPVAYEPPTDCTCIEGMCDVDHAND